MVGIVIMNGSICEFEGMGNLINNVVLVFIIDVMGQILIILVGWMNDIGNVR